MSSMPLTETALDTGGEPRAPRPAPPRPLALPLGSTGLELFPYAVCRVARHPFDSIAALRSPESVEAV
ncbi:MAG: hypothetical protein MI919_06095, partial [Holophagales bacterium]|nr:hypothetical protein [Holophagales bacterium]